MMKFKNYIFLIVLGVLLASCSSDNSGSGEEFIRATVETLSFESISELLSGPTAAKIDGGDEITYIVQGADNAGNILVLTVSNYQGPGTYNIGADTQNSSGSGFFFNQQLEAWSSAIDGGTGSITVITDDDEETTGNFEFTGVSELDASTRFVSNGRFSVNFEN